MYASHAPNMPTRHVSWCRLPVHHCIHTSIGTHREAKLSIERACQSQASMLRLQPLGCAKQQHVCFCHAVTTSQPGRHTDCVHHPGLHEPPLFFSTHYAVVYLQGGRGPSRIERDRMKLALLEEAHIVCSTLSFSGSGLFAQMSRKFDVVVIDEAAQAVEPAILVPLVQGVKQVSKSSAPVLQI